MADAPESPPAAPPESLRPAPPESLRPASPESLRGRAAELLAGLLALGFAVPVLLAVGQAIAARLSYPGDIEWMEGATLVSAQRAHDGLSLYGAPAGAYIPFIYPPLYAWILAALGHIWPLGYTLGRTVSTLGSIAGGAALVFAARREGANWFLSLATLGLFAACWDDSGTFYDLVRTDGVALGLMSWAVVLAPVPSPWATMASGTLLAIAFMAKQHVALLGLPLLAWTWWTHGRERALLFAKTSLIPALGFVVVMSAFSGGRFAVWLALVPAVHGQTISRLIPGAQLECWKALPITTTAVLLTLPWWARRRSYWAAVAAMTLIIVSLMRGHTGGYLNVLIPMLWLQGLLPIVAASAFRGSGGRILAGVFVAAQCLCWNLDWNLFKRRVSGGQAIAKAWNDAQLSLDRFIPTEEDVTTVNAFVEELRTLPEPVLIPHGPWYAVMAGKKSSFALITLWDIDHKRGVYEPNVAVIEAAMNHDFRSAVLPDDTLGHDFADHWEVDHALKHRSPSTRTGWPVKMRTVYRLKGAGE